MLFINVYLPCRSSAHREEFIDCLDSILHDVIDILHYDKHYRLVFFIVVLSA